MATIEQENLARTELTGFLNDLNSVDISTLSRREELGTMMNFEPGLPYFERSLRLYRDLSRVETDTVPYETLVLLRDRARELLAIVKEVREFTYAKYPNNAEAQRDSLINNVRDRYGSEFAQITPVIAYGVRSGTDFNRLEREAKTVLSEMSTLLAEQKSTKEATAKTVEDTLSEVRKLAREAGVSQHAELFQEEAIEHQKAATKWLNTTIWVAIGTTLTAVGLLVVSWFFTPSDITTTKAVQIGIAKIALLSLLFSALLWVGRMYRSHRHNYVVNRHRLNALRTFETFARAANDDPTKNAVLIQATQCIFSPQNTGYVSGETESNPASQILEIVRTVGKSAS